MLSDLERLRKKQKITKEVVSSSEVVVVDRVLGSSNFCFEADLTSSSLLSVVLSSSQKKARARTRNLATRVEDLQERLVSRVESARTDARVRFWFISSSRLFSFGTY